MTKHRWTRERAKSGPADTLNGRWEIRRGGGRWGVFDRTLVGTSSNGRVGNAYGYTTMAAARAAAEAMAAKVPA